MRAALLFGRIFGYSTPWHCPLSKCQVTSAALRAHCGVQLAPILVLRVELLYFCAL